MIPNPITMRKIIFMAFIAGFALISCNSAKRAEAEKKRTKEKMERLEKDKEDFKRKNEGELK